MKGLIWRLWLCGLLAAVPAAAQEAVERERYAIDEQILFGTIAEQGGRSHASGDRPELGPQQLHVMSRGDVPLIRVGITPTLFAENGSVLQEYWTAAAHNHGAIEITSTGGIEVVDLSSGRLVFAGHDDALTFVKASDGTISLSGPYGPIGWFIGPLVTRPGPGALLIANSVRRINRLAGGQLTPAPYRGDLEVLASTADLTKLRLVNVVRLDPDYVTGVIPNESLASFHVEALKTQAIAARGYAVANIGRFASRGFDIDDSTLSQVYRGQSSEIAVSLAAARETDGLVLTRDGRIVSTLYSSSMGGHTESNEYVFPSPPGSYPGTNADRSLRAVHDGTETVPGDLSTEQGVRTFYSTIYLFSNEVHPVTGIPLTSLHRWTRTRTAAELLARLKESFSVPASAATIGDIRTTLRGDSGRVMQIVVSGDWGTTEISGWSDLRRLATLAGVTPGGTAANSAPNSPSTYEVTYDGNSAVTSVLFYGGGFGHNVGMSQYGSQGRALRGQTALDILSAYYSGAETTTIPLLLSWYPVEQVFFLPSARATLVIDNGGLEGIYLKINHKWLFVITPPYGRIEVSLTGLLDQGSNVILFFPISEFGASAITRVRMERN
jgi:SpoIID/LytB domain protein